MAEAPAPDPVAWDRPPVRVGLVGAGPWALLVHAPVLAAGPETELSGIWARRPDAAAELASAHGVPAHASFDELLDGCDAVAFAVPPDVQADLAVRAARAGRALLLEKPVALDVPAAERLADAVGESGVASVVTLTWRFSRPFHDLVAQVDRIEPFGGGARFLTGALTGGFFATPWRLERGALPDLGPHVVDGLWATLGPVVDVRATGRRRGMVALQLEHESGAVSTAAVSGDVPGDPGVADLILVGDGGSASADLSAAASPSTFARLRRTFALAATGSAASPLDVHHGLALVRLLDRAERDLA